jgi:general secretion pathway protein D
MKILPLPPSLTTLLATAALFAAMPLGRVHAQTDTEQKIRLMSQALAARDAGDIPAAQRALAELGRLTPNDPQFQRLKAEVEAQAAARQTALAEQAAAEAAAAARKTEDAARKTDAGGAMTISVPSAVAPSPVVSPASAGSAMVDVRIPEPGQTPPSVVPATTAAPTAAEIEVDAMARAEATRQTTAMANAQAQLATARAQIRNGQPADAIATVDAALASLPVNPLTQKLVSDLTREKASALLDQAQLLLRRGDLEGARIALAAHNQLAPGSARAAGIERQLARTDGRTTGPGLSPTFVAERAATAQLIAKGRAQYTAGDIDGAQETFRLVESQEPDNSIAKGFLLRIAQEKAETGALNREKTRTQLLEEVAKSWQRPGIYQERSRELDHSATTAPLMKKLNDITLPMVSFTRAEIGQVVQALSAASEEFDAGVGGTKGVNIVLLDPSNKNPAVTISLRNATLKRVLDFVTEAAGYQYEVQADAVVVRPGGETSTLETSFFPITRATVLRMTGLSAPGGAGGKDPYVPGSTAGEPANTGGEAAGMRGFLQQAGVSFTVEGSSLAYDGSAIIVTQTARNIERIRNILARYNDVRQVEIESKFIEVQEGALEEMGVQWALSRRGVPQINPATGAPILDANGRQVFVPQEVYGTSSINRTLSNAFNAINSVAGINIIGGTTTQTSTTNGIPTTTTTSAGSQNVPMNAPVIPGGVALGTGTTPLANISGFVGEFDVNAIIRALAQKQGTDLLSSPKVTVLSGNPANITVAQELRYPQSYGEIQSQVSGGTGGTSVTITAGTPQEFTMRNVGVELKVTPTVEEDDYSISLDLNPKVTEFEGFVEYGGPSVAISNGTSVTVPPGFYQPIFSVRDISTKVTIWDGATLVMGGLTREEVKKVNDKVPFFGDIPLVGRLFRSKGESSQKRNLLIFVTANLVSPGGSPKKQSLKSTPANSIFQNPTIVTPASAEPRTRNGEK